MRTVDREPKVVCVDGEGYCRLPSGGRARDPNSHTIAVGYANVGQMHRPAVGLKDPWLEPLHCCTSYADHVPTLAGWPCVCPLPFKRPHRGCQGLAAAAAQTFHL